MKLYLYFVAAMMTLLLASPSYAQNVRGTVTGKSIQLSITGGFKPYTYKWSDGSTTAGLDNLPNGQYCVTVSDALCGTASQCFEVKEPCALDGTLSIQVKTSPCKNASNGNICALRTSRSTRPEYELVSYKWSTGATTSCIPVASGSYSLTATDGRGCVGKVSQLLEEIPIIVTETVSEACKTVDGLGAIQLTPVPELAINFYKWSNGATTKDISGLQPGNYSVTVSDRSNCSITKTIAVTKASMTNDVIVAKVSNNTDCTSRSTCNANSGADGAIELEILRPRTYNYSWLGTTTGLPNAPKVSRLCPGYYNVIVSIANVPQCQLALAESVCCCFYEPTIGNKVPPVCTNNNPTTLTVTLDPKSPSTQASADGQIKLITTGGTGKNKIKWTLPDNTIIRDQIILTGLSKAGKYCVTINDGCSDITKCVELEFCSNVVISVSQQITKTCDCTINADCNAGKIQLTSVTGGITPHKFSWSNGKATKDIDNLSKGNYVVTVTTASGCSQIKSYTIDAVATAFLVNASDCRFYDEVCPINNKVVKLKAKSASTGKTRINLANCTVEEICANGNGVPIETLLAGSETMVYKGDCVSVEFCKSISTGVKYLRKVTNIGYTYDYKGKDFASCPAERPLRYDVYCGKEYIGYDCKQAAGPSEALNGKNDNSKNSVLMLSFLDSLITDNVPYYIPKSVNKATTITEYEAIISQSSIFDIDDLKVYRPSKNANGISEKNINNLKVFPNPFNNSFTIEVESESSYKASISIYNSFGQVIIINNYNFTKGKNVVNIDAKQLKESFYVVEVIDEKGLRMTQKILKATN